MHLLGNGNKDMAGAKTRMGSLEPAAQYSDEGVPTSRWRNFPGKVFGRCHGDIIWIRVPGAVVIRRRGGLGNGSEDTDVLMNSDGWESN